MKQYLVTAEEMKRYDANTIERFHIPGLLLMERAALATVEELQRLYGKVPCKVLVMAGCGNNGGDGLAVGRLLMLQGYEVTFVMPGEGILGRCTEETRQQISILQGYQAQIFSTIREGEYDIVVDAVFGVGLSRPVEGIWQDAIQWINRSNAFVCSVDIPSGIQADTGSVMGCAVRADLTVTYGFYKIGHMLYPGAAYSKALVCRQMGIDERSFLDKPPYWYTYSGTDYNLLPVRLADGNKGTFGKALLIVGSKDIAGAAMMAAKSTFRMGAGMVRVVTPVENRETVQQFIPEAMLLPYQDHMSAEEEKDFLLSLREAESWADCILVGPGIGMGRTADRLLRFAVLESTLPLVIDADGLNLLAQDQELQKAMEERKQQSRVIILTPHLGEFARIYGCTTAQGKEHLTDYPRRLADRLRCIVVCKDARTVVVQCQGRQGYINTTGNSGMATAGSGDVLAGMITGLLAQGMAGMDAAVAGVWLHGFAGDLAAERETEPAMMATDIIDSIKTAVSQIQGKRRLSAGTDQRRRTEVSE